MKSRDKPPHVILIMSDSHTPYALGFNASQARTPNLDCLASESIVFDNCYCNSPVCGPSRFSFLTGKYVHNCGAYDNASTLPVDQPTLGHLMTAAGYRTVFVGRMHLHGMNQMIGFEERPVHDWINPVDAPPDHYHEEFELREFSPPTQYNEYQADPNIIKTYDDSVSAEAVNIIRHHRQMDSRPLFLMVGFTGPHPAVAGREVYRDAYNRYMNMDLILPEFGDQDVGQLPPYQQRLLKVFGKMPWRISKRLTAEYFARVEYFDSLWGQIDRELKEKGMFEDSLIIYTSDHGENMGYHGNWGKMNFYERAVKVPLFIHQPDGEMRKIQENVSLVDLFPTLAEIADQTVEYPLDGKSLLPLLENRGKSKSGEVFSEYHGYCSPCGAFMLVKNGLKYCHYNSLPPELYDLDKDPEETDNLAGNPAYHRSLCQIRKRFLEIVPDPMGIEIMIRNNQARRSLINGAVRQSKVMQKQLQERIHAYRKERCEPWWDGGKTIAQHETQFTKIKTAH